MPTPEGQTKRIIDRFLKSLGDDCWYYKPVPAKFGSRTVDYHGIYKGLGFVIEAKRPGEEPTKLQMKHLQDVATARGAAFWIDGETKLGTFKAWIAEVDRLELSHEHQSH